MIPVAISYNNVCILSTAGVPTLEVCYHRGSKWEESRYLRVTYDGDDIVVTLINPSSDDIEKLNRYHRNETSHELSLGMIGISESSSGDMVMEPLYITDTADYNESNEPVNPAFNITLGTYEINISNRQIRPLISLDIPLKRSNAVVVTSSHSVKFGVMNA